MKTFAVAMLAAVGSGLGLSTVVDQRPAIDETVEASKEALVTVRVPHGNIVIEGWDRAEVRVRGGGVAPDALDLYSDHSHTQIRLRGDSDADTWFTIRVPRGSSVDVETVGGHVGVDGVEGVVRLESESGDLVLAGSPASIVALSRSGNIDVRVANASGLVHSEEGEVRLREALSGEILAGRDAARAQQTARAHLEDQRARVRETESRVRRDARARQQEVERAIRRAREEARRRSDDRWRSGQGEDWTQYAGSELGDAVARIVRESAWALEGLQELVEVEEWDGGVEINVADVMDVNLDLDALEEMLEAAGEEVGEQLEALAEELEDRYERLAEEVERRYRESRRNRR
jgi:hypothetical protein